ncbi:MAG TPA: WYL domain-containing protein [Gammaproteobacteria bacterium]|nr:WYL domain-containing protein [Gammaproteobacteria bacterium]
MAPSYKSAPEVKRGTRQRLQYIEVMAYYTGIITRSDVVRAFGISDAAATKDLKLYGDLAPGNLHYQHRLFGFVPTDDFTPLFADLDPAVVLPLLANNLVSAGEDPQQGPLYGIPVEALPLPARFPSPEVLAPVIRAIRHGRQVEVQYRSLSDAGHVGPRILEPHALVNTGLRWHVRAYNHDNYDFRDFVLSRIHTATLLEDAAESTAAYDDDWVEQVVLQLAPHPKLPETKRHNLLMDYAAEDGVIALTVRRALLGYVLQRLAVDTTPDHALNPDAWQLVVLNRDEIEPFAGWAFL